MKTIPLRTILIACCTFAALVILPAVLFAQTTQPCTTSFCPLADTPSNSKLGQLYGSSPDLATFLGNLFTAALSIGAILAVLRLGYAGYEYMTSEAWGNKQHAKEVIGDVVLGLLLLLSVYLILHQINPDILKLNFHVPQMQPSGSGAPTNTNASNDAGQDPYQVTSEQQLQIQSGAGCNGAC